MSKEIIVEKQEEFYNNLRDEPCIVCGDPYAYVLGSYTPEAVTPPKDIQDKIPVLFYSLCEQCFNYGRIPTARIEAVYRKQFGKIAA